MINDQDTRWYITNYESTYTGRRPKKPRPSEIALLPWDGVILDESTGIKNPRAIRTKMCRKYFGTSPYKAILTGLAAPEGPMDYFEQQAFTYGQFMGCKTFWQFRQKYFHLGYSDYDWVANKGTLSAIKKEVNKNSFVLTRKQAGMGSKKIYEHRYVELPPKVRKEYTKLEDDFCLSKKETKWTIVVKIWLARLAGGQPEEKLYCSPHKFQEILYLLNTELKNEQCIIWFRFNLELLYVHRMLKVKGIHSDFIAGETFPAEREQIRKRFNKGNFRCLLIQIKCGKFGIDCSAASTALYYSNSFSYEDRSQSEARGIHPDKKEPFLILDILTKNTVDEDVYKALRKKKMNSKIFSSQILKNLRRRHGRA